MALRVTDNSAASVEIGIVDVFDAKIESGLDRDSNSLST